MNSSMSLAESLVREFNWLSTGALIEYQYIRSIQFFPWNMMDGLLKSHQRETKCNTQGCEESKLFFPSKGTKGLWFVSSWICLTRTYSENFSQAQVTASASFSICAYLRSVSVNKWEANAMGFQSSLCFCESTAPRPYKEASALILVSAVS